MAGFGIGGIGSWSLPGCRRFDFLGLAARRIFWILTFNFESISPRDAEGTLAGAGVSYSQFRIKLHLQLQLHFAPRCALAGDLLLSVATKVGKSAFTGGSCSRCWPDGSGGWVSGIGFRLRDLLVRAVSVRLWHPGDEEIPASMVIGAGLSRSCRTDRPGMLKWVPDWAVAKDAGQSRPGFFSGG